MIKLPKVSVVIPVYNMEKYIKECVESVLNQDYPNLETIVVDDGSTDNTQDILETFKDEIKFIRQPHRGAAAALNQGIREATGEFICWLSADDVFLPQKISLQVEVFQNYPGIGVVYTDCIYIDENGNEIIRVKYHSARGVGDIFDMFVIGNYINGSSIMIKRNLLFDVGLFDETLIADADFDMWIRLMKNGVKFYRLPYFLLKYRIHSQQQSQNIPLMLVFKERVRSTLLLSLTPQEIIPSANSPTKIASMYNLIYRSMLRTKMYSTAYLCILKAKEQIGWARELFNIIFLTLAELMKIIF